MRRWQIEGTDRAQLSKHVSRKGTSVVKYWSKFCSGTIENFLLITSKSSLTPRALEKKKSVFSQNCHHTQPKGRKCFFLHLLEIHGGKEQIPYFLRRIRRKSIVTCSLVMVWVVENKLLPHRNAHTRTFFIIFSHFLDDVFPQ